MAFDFTHIAGGGGALGPVLGAIDIGIDAALCAATGGLACFKIVVDIFLEVFEIFFGNIFQGRPKLGKDSATDDVALFFIASPNPVTALWGMGFRILEAKGIPLSTSSAQGRSQYENVARAALKDLQRQFGPSAGLTIFTQYAYLSSLNNPDSNGEALRARQTVDQHYKDGVQKGKINPETGFPPVGQPPYDPFTPQPGPCTDPCSNALQQLITTSVVPLLNQAASALYWLRPTLGPSLDGEHMSAIENIAQCICRLVDTVQSGFGALIQASQTGGRAFDPQVAAQLKRIADDLDIFVKGTGPDAKVRALAKQMVSDGVLSSDLGQILTS